MYSVSQLDIYTRHGANLSIRSPLDEENAPTDFQRGSSNKELLLLLLR